MNAQDCKLEQNEVDAFTKIKKVKTKTQTIAVTNSTSIKFSFLKNSNVYIKLWYHSGGMSSIVIGTQNAMLLMLQNDELIELFPVEIVSGNINSLNDTEIECRYIISKENIKKIKDVGLKKVRFNSTKYHYDFDVEKKKWIEKLNQQIDCFLKELD